MSYRQEHSITEHEHDQLLGLFGWTPDEYEEGERAPDDIDLEREKDILKDDNGYKVIELRNGQKMNKEEQNVWDRGRFILAIICVFNTDTIVTGSVQQVLPNNGQVTGQLRDQINRHRCKY